MKNQIICVPGSQGFISSQIVKLLLKNGYTVLGVDSYEKYGYVKREHDDHPNFVFKKLCVIKDFEEFKELFFKYKPSKMIQACASIGGIEFFHRKAYDLVASNDRIMANCFDLCIEGHKQGWFDRIVVLSSSMVYESTNNYPTKESDIKIIPPPISTYGFSKLNAENYCHGAFQQYGLKYVICRPFNACGVEEISVQETIIEGNKKSMMSHVIPDLTARIIFNTNNGNDPVMILGNGNQVRCYTSNVNISECVIMAMESDKAINEDFNISIAKSHTVLELAELIWNKIYPNKEFKYTTSKPFTYDVQKRIPDVTKAKEILGFEANISLEETLDVIVEFFKRNMTNTEV